MKKGMGIIIAVVAVVIVLVLVVMSSYNKMVTASEDVDNKYATIETQLERRADLIPNLVDTVKGYLTHEKSVIDSITKSRQNLLNASTLEEKAKANNELTGALSALAVVVENYPDLKANTNFLNLQDELSGTENRISTARKDYNDSVKEYNTLIKKFPTKLMASMFKFESKVYFEAKETSHEVPNVNFE